MAKEPGDRFRSMDELCSELSDCLSGLDGAVSSGAETLVVAPQRRRQRRPARPPAGRPSVWPLILLLAGLAVLAVILAAVFTFTDATEKIRSAAGGKSSTPATAGPVDLSGVAAYDPFGDQHEHDEAVGFATDGNPSTFWTTEHYQGFTKPGVGLVLDAGSAKKVSRLTVRSDTPGFTAVVKAGSSPSGTFTKVSSPATAGTSTSFAVDGQAARYYVIWITDLGGGDAVHVNEVNAKGG
jgi:hypothetical protein